MSISTIGEKGVFNSCKKISMLQFCNWKKMHSEAEFLFWEICFPFMTNNTNLGKKVKNQNHNVQYTGTKQIHLSDVSLYPTLTIQASSRLKRSAKHLWNNSDVCRKKFGKWSPLWDEWFRKVCEIWLLKLPQGRIQNFDRHYRGNSHAVDFRMQ